MSQSEIAYSKICEMITQGQLKKDYPLFEQDLAKQFKMSRTPVREALQKLIAEGTVEQLPRRGIFVKTLNKKEINDSYIASEGMEGMVAYEVAQKRTQKDVERMKKLLLEMEHHYQNGDADAWAKADEQLHRINYEICDNKFITDALSKINIQVHRVRYLISRIILDKNKSNEDHKRIIAAIEAKDSEQARQAAFIHMQRIRTEVAKILDMNIFQ